MRLKAVYPRLHFWLGSACLSCLNGRAATDHCEGPEAVVEATDVSIGPWMANNLASMKSEVCLVIGLCIGSHHLDLILIK